MRNNESSDVQATVAEVRAQFDEATKAVADFATTCAEDFRSFERRLIELVWNVGRLAVALFLAQRHERCVVPQAVERAGRRFRPAPAQPRNLNTMFGVVRYWRTYLREVAPKDRHGFHPLDAELGLTGDRMSLGLMVVAVRLALRLSFAEARSTLGLFVPCVPSTEVIEKTVLGLGKHTAPWFESAQPPSGDGKDGKVLVIQVDGKGVPTATQSELERRRGKRKKHPKRCRCRRHRGRDRRRRYGKKPRRKKGDKSKNARVATMVVMYTLREGNDGRLHGPINVWRYASFAPKRHAFAIARREAAKRGFGPESGRRVQLATDGDDDFAVYAKEYLPHALHTIDVMHVVEKLWRAGECLYDEGTQACTNWVEARKDELYKGKVAEILAHLGCRLDATPKTGPGNKGKRERLSKVIGYLEKRTNLLAYNTLIAEDLELGTGLVEGSIKNILGKRCDHGGMRWIEERVEAIVQLRCIEANGDFDRFVDFVYERLRSGPTNHAAIPRLQADTPAPLPDFGIAA